MTSNPVYYCKTQETTPGTSMDRNQKSLALLIAFSACVVLFSFWLPPEYLLSRLQRFVRHEISNTGKDSFPLSAGTIHSSEQQLDSRAAVLYRNPTANTSFESSAELQTGRFVTPVSKPVINFDDVRDLEYSISKASYVADLYNTM